mgnify:CR=1 FL=1
MQDISKIKLRIIEFLKYKGLSDIQFCNITGVTRGVIKQSNGISEENLYRVIEGFPEINIVWLITGEGDMLKNQDFSKIENNEDSSSNLYPREFVDQLMSNNTKLTDSFQKLTDSHYLLVKDVTDLLKEIKSKK